MQEALHFVCIPYWLPPEVVNKIQEDQVGEFCGPPTREDWEFDQWIDRMSADLKF